MEYYLDTGALYHINKIPQNILKESFYSIFGLLEIVAGINSNNFQKRSAILGSIAQSQILQDQTFPEHLIFRAFSCYDEYDFVEKRVGDINHIAQEIISSNSFTEFEQLNEIKKKEFDFNYFVKRDLHYSQSFLQNSLKGNEDIDSILRDGEEQYVEFENGVYNLNSRRLVINFLEGSSVNSSITVLALANATFGMMGQNSTDSEVEKIYNSYNGLLDIFVEGLSSYSSNQILNSLIPGRNDSQDLIHLLYLRNYHNIKIVSNDKLFTKCIPTKTITLEALLKKMV